MAGTRKVLVTGAAGFIGAHLARTLAKQGDRVVGFDIAPFDPEMNSVPNLELVQADIRDADAVARSMNGVDVVFHQAAMASVPESFADPAKCMDVNATGSANVFEQARLAGVKRVVMASTSAIYGEDPTPLKNETLIPDPRSPYAVSKLAMEQLANVYAQQYGMEMVALRYFNVYGPGQPAEGGYAAVIPAIRRAQSTGTPFTLYGDGEQIRSFIYVGDVARANSMASTANLDTTNGVVVVNIAGTDSVSLNTLLQTIGEISGSEIAMDRQPERDGDIRHSAGDATLARTLIGFSAEVGLEDGLSFIIDSADRG